MKRLLLSFLCGMLFVIFYAALMLAGKNILGFSKNTIDIMAIILSVPKFIYLNILGLPIPENSLGRFIFDFSSSLIFHMFLYSFLFYAAFRIYFKINPKAEKAKEIGNPPPPPKFEVE